MRYGYMSVHQDDWKRDVRPTDRIVNVHHSAMGSTRYEIERAQPFQSRIAKKHVRVWTRATMRKD
mgnify:CR=1 FL=1